MKTSSSLGGRIRTYYWLILAIWSVFGHFFEKEKSGRFTGFSGRGFWETEAEPGPDWGWGRCSGIVRVFLLPKNRN